MALCWFSIQEIIVRAVYLSLHCSFFECSTEHYRPWVLFCSEINVLASIVGKEKTASTSNLPI